MKSKNYILYVISGIFCLQAGVAKAEPLAQNLPVVTTGDSFQKPNLLKRLDKESNLNTSNGTASTTDLKAIEQAKELYESGQFLEVVKVLKYALETFRASKDAVGEAMALSNLSTALQQLGQWTEAKEAIASSLEIISRQNQTPESLKVLAQTLNTQGSLQLAQGQPEKALISWQQAAATYAKVQDQTGINRALINQAQAMQAMGLYRRALESLQQVKENLQSSTDSRIKASGLRSLGNVLRLVGNLEESRQVLEESLSTNKRLLSPQDVSDTLLSLGNTVRAQGNTKAALDYYQQAATPTASPNTRTRALLNQLSLLVDTNEGAAALALVPQIQAQLNSLPVSRTSVEGKINLAQSLIKLGNSNPGFKKENQEEEEENPIEKQLEITSSSPLPITNSQDIAQILATAIQEAKSQGNQRAESFALGQLAAVYEQNNQLNEALDLTRQALLLAQSVNASDITYRWQWQMGRLLKAKGDTKGAIVAYGEAVKLLQSLRSDLVSINPDVQFSFRESVEPIYRQLVGLLLQPPATKTQISLQNSPNSKIADQKSEQPTQENLAKARQLIESLQLAELDNFFQEACLQAKPVEVDKLDPQAAIVYPIILEDRLEVIISIPKQPLRRYTTLLSRSQLESTLDRLKQNLTPIGSKKTQLRLSQQIYEWLIRASEKDLTNNGIKTLVFVLDGSLRNLPMATLHDGKEYLIEKYSIAMSPGLQLFEASNLSSGKVEVLKGGLSDARQGFPALPAVASEINQIASEVPGKVLLNKDLTSANLQDQLNTAPFRIIHLATHGQFSSNAKDTFILTWDGTINVKDLDKLFRARGQSGLNPLELLVLSACQTASGDNRATLGLAGVAVRSGARSTIATLWSVKDDATAVLMTQFYKELSPGKVTKAEALRRAQLSLLRDRRFAHPIYWAPFVLIGNWL